MFELRTMSSIYKRLIVKKILKNVIGSTELTGEHLEQRIGQLIRIQPAFKGSSHDSQFFVELPRLSKCLNGQSVNLDQVQVESGLDVTVADDILQFRIEPQHFTKVVLSSVRSEKDKYGYLSPSAVKKECIGVEFSSPNVAKPFHVGHLRSTIIGNVISNMYEAAGHDVKRINFIGDWGTQFGLLSLGLMRYSHVQMLKADPLLELFKVYVRINEEVKSECGKASEMSSETYQKGMELVAQLEQGDPSMKAVWQMVKKLSSLELDKMYQRLGVRFTHSLAESDYQGKTDQVVERLQQANLLKYDEDGVGYVEVPGRESIGRAGIIKSDGSSLYLTRDIASALDRQEQFGLDRMHYIVEQGQRGHFIKLTNVLNQLGVPWAKRPIDDIHVRFGRVKGMSSRRGTVVFLRDVLDEARTRIEKSMSDKATTRIEGDLESVADSLGVCAIILQDLKSHRTKDYTFSWEQMLSFKSDSGVFVQYCHARLCSMLKNCSTEITDDVDMDCLLQDVPLYKLLLHLARYPEVFEDSLASLEPHHVVHYLFKLCHLTNTAYATCPVKGAPNDIAQARLLVFDCSRQVLANCLTVLGLRPLEEI